MALGTKALIYIMITVFTIIGSSITSLGSLGIDCAKQTEDDSCTTFGKQLSLTLLSPQVLMQSGAEKIDRALSDEDITNEQPIDSVTVGKSQIMIGLLISLAHLFLIYKLVAKGGRTLSWGWVLGLTFLFFILAQFVAGLILTGGIINPIGGFVEVLRIFTTIDLPETATSLDSINPSNQTNITNSISVNQTQ